MIYINTNNRLSIECDAPDCSRRFHPRYPARNNTELRQAAQNRGWQILSNAREFCSYVCERFKDTICTPEAPCLRYGCHTCDTAGRTAKQC